MKDKLEDSKCFDENGQFHVKTHFPTTDEYGVITWIEYKRDIVGEIKEEKENEE